MGPIKGKTYLAGYMAPAKTFGIEREERLAELLSYIRYAWGKEGDCIEKELVSQVRKKYEKRSTPWTDPELKGLKGEVSLLFQVVNLTDLPVTLHLGQLHLRMGFFPNYIAPLAGPTGKKLYPNRSPLVFDR